MAEMKRTVDRNCLNSGLFLVFLLLSFSFHFLFFCYVPCYVFQSFDYIHAVTCTGKPSLIPNGMRLYRLSVPTPAHKLLALIDLYETLTIQQAVVFCSTRRCVPRATSCAVWGCVTSW